MIRRIKIQAEYCDVCKKRLHGGWLVITLRGKKYHACSQAASPYCEDTLRHRLDKGLKK